MTGPRSLWHETSPLIEVDTTLPARADVVVVGAGIAGLSTAAQLARAGRSVAVLEARDVGAVATGNTTAKLSLLQGSTFSGIRSHAGDDALEAYVAANRAGQEWVRGELDGEGIDQRDAFTYATTEEGDRGIEQELEALAAVGLDVDVLGAGQDHGLPYPVTRAIRMRGQWQIHPMRLLAKLAASVRDHGGSVVTGTRVLGADITDDGALVTTSRGPVLADQVVVTSGFPVIDKAGFFARLKPSRSLVGAYRVPGEVPSGMYLSLDPQSRSLRTAEGLLVVGGPAWTTGRERETDRMLRELDAWTAAAFPGATRELWWAAQDYQTVTHVPFYGAVSDRIYAATGFNKWGMTNGAAAALTIAGEILGTPVPWDLSPHVKLRDGAEFVSAQAGVAASAVTGIVRAVAGSGALAEGEGRVTRDGLHPVAESQVDGVTCRVSGVCTHMGGILQWNRAERSWDCPLHASRFAPDGTVLEGPATEPLEQR
ncbi:FAD-dependent oxidoreductase [Microbacterium paludicola]|uniref:FAD-dependent oxidoreductase n=1 Tax=Microbacterium paludicola TaxID=300019 RepID=A0A4Y9FPX8_9MICO|nr:FAD-dependent oxidoreductase [Microbacterium paludicola]MBF0817438.1 FAD-dependent oxidoreductase [Microbacterium paludicola]TFU31274.1 FAD-dependent oxidoreductase [Microbacterium paludicola]